MDWTKLQPKRDRVFIKCHKSQEVIGKIYIPEDARQKQYRGTVLAIGREIGDINVGDVICYDNYSGAKIKIDEDEYLILKDEDILGIIEE